LETVNQVVERLRKKLPYERDGRMIIDIRVEDDVVAILGGNGEREDIPLSIFQKMFS